jgi:hypothetical protein
MEITDIVQEYAQESKPVENKQEEIIQTEKSEPSSLTEDITSEAPTEVSNESAYESLLTGKTNVKSESENSNTDTELVPREMVADATNLESLEPSTDTFNEDASGMNDVIEEDDFIKTKTDGQFGSWDEVVDAINQSSAPKFENEMSEAIYNLLLEGKIDDVVDILGTKKFAEDIKSGDDEDVLKAYIKVNNPEFDDDDVDSEYEEKYQIDEYSFDESKLKREQKKLSQRIRNDVENAKEFFDSLAQEIKLPELSRNTESVEQQDDSEMEALIQEQRSSFLSSLNGVESRVSSLPFSWKDEKSNVAVNGKFDIPAQELSKYRQAAEDLESYQVDRYYKDGKYNADRLVKELYISDNLDKIITSAVSQAVNQTRLEMLKQSKNIQTENNPSGTFRPNAADEESAMYEQLFMGHLKRQ